MRKKDDTLLLYHPPFCHPFYFLSKNQKKKKKKNQIFLSTLYRLLEFFFGFLEASSNLFLGFNEWVNPCMIQADNHWPNSKTNTTFLGFIMIPFFISIQKVIHVFYYRNLPTITFTDLLKLFLLCFHLQNVLIYEVYVIRKSKRPNLKCVRTRNQLHDKGSEILGTLQFLSRS